MKILVVSQYYYPEPFRINEICEELVKRGHNVTVLTANPNYPDGEIYNGYENKESEEIINGVRVYRCKCRPRYKGALNLARNYIDFVIQANSKIVKLSEKFDCIYVYQLSPITSCLPAIKYKKKKKIPILLYCLDVWPESLRGSILGNKIGMKVFTLLSRYIYKSADLIAVTSPSFKHYIGKLCNIEESSIKYIPQHSNGVRQISRNDVTKQEKILNFVFMGNIGETQNLECLLKALSYIEDKKEFKFHIVGSGSSYEKCIKLATDLGVNDVVIFHGRYPKNEMKKFYSMADVCYVSLKEQGIVGNTIPGKVQEYMSAGKPILACMNGDTVKIIKEANCGICVPAGNDYELARAIKKMFNSRKELKSMGENSKKYFYDHFTLDSHINQIEYLLGELVK